jgi:formylaminopyrimidine deformylase
MKLDTSAQKVLEAINVDELIKVTLDLGNIDSPTGSEGPVADYVYEWLRRQGFEARKEALVPDRPNVIGRLLGGSFGRSLVFNSHSQERP